MDYFSTCRPRVVVLHNNGLVNARTGSIQRASIVLQGVAVRKSISVLYHT